MNNKIRLNKITVIERSFKSRISSKATDYHINSSNQNKQIKINIAETHQLCVPIDYDCNYFIAKGVLPTSIDKCQLGKVTSLGIIENNTEFEIQYEGKVTYAIRNSKVNRLPLTGYVKKTITNIALNLIYVRVTWDEFSQDQNSSKFMFPGAFNLLNNLEGDRPLVYIYPISVTPDLYNDVILSDLTGVNPQIPPQIFRIGDDVLNFNTFYLFDPITNDIVNNINFNSNSWPTTITGFVILLKTNSNFIGNETLLLYSKCYDGATITSIPPNTPTIKLNTSYGVAVRQIT